MKEREREGHEPPLHIKVQAANLDLLIVLAFLVNKNDHHAKVKEERKKEKNERKGTKERSLSIYLSIYLWSKQENAKTRDKGKKKQKKGLKAFLRETNKNTRIERKQVGRRRATSF